MKTQCSNVKDLFYTKNNEKRDIRRHIVANFCYKDEYIPISKYPCGKKEVYNNEIK